MSQTPYRVLARKYRPNSFDELIGQEAMIRTLRNAFSVNRIAQAYMLTGVRGVGKTTTARILARALNFDNEEGSGSPTVDLNQEGIHCRAIMESHHVDVVEMDAASHTGIDDVREIIESAHYRPASARYKVYIIDEVHMLSTAAFNGLLKTLEEPPPHVKFIFATTEIRKVPVTILSRCQRFDLRRIEPQTLQAHLQKILEAEALSATPEALSIVARIAEGSVRDALSLLDQAIAHAGGAITEDTLNDMLGLADQQQTHELFEYILTGKADQALQLFGQLYEKGADPVQILQDMARLVHTLSKYKAAPKLLQNQAITSSQKQAIENLGAQTPMSALARIWQMLLALIPQVQGATMSYAAAEMGIIRIAYASTLPDLLQQQRPATEAAPPRPSSNIRLAAEGQGTNLAHQPRFQPEASSEPQETKAIKNWQDVLELAIQNREMLLKSEIEHDIRLVTLEQGRLEIALEPHAEKDVAQRLSAGLQNWTGQRWLVTLSQEKGQETVGATQKRETEAKRKQALEHPLVAKAMDLFPGAEITAIMPRKIEISSFENDLESNLLTSEGEEDE